jgi:type IV pilus assembly protein PilA
MKSYIIVAVILALFIFVTIPNFVSVRIPNPEAYSKSDLKNAFTAAQAYFSDYPNGSVNQENLKSYGFRASKGVTLSLGGTSENNLSMNTRHKKGKKTFHIDREGNIKEDPPDTDTLLGNFKKSISRHLFIWRVVIGF